MSTDYEIEQQTPTTESNAPDSVASDETEASQPATKKPEEELFFWSEPGVCG